jgi:cytochrome c-type biogenesis protein CcmH/NrfG
MVVLPLILLTVFVAALVDIILRRDDQVRYLPKLAWVLIVILLPLIGSVLWFTVGREYQPRPSRPRTVGMPGQHRPSAQAPSAPAPSAGSTEAQLAALEREIEEADRARTIRRLEDELRRRNDAGETA